MDDFKLFDFNAGQQNREYASFDEFIEEFMHFFDHLSILYSNSTGEDIEEYVFSGRNPEEEEIDAAFGFPKRGKYETLIDERANKMAIYIEGRFTETIEKKSSDFGVRLARVFEGREYTKFQLFCLALALLPEFNIKYETMYSNLINDNSFSRATIGLAMDCYRLIGNLSYKDVLEVIDSSNAINDLFFTSESISADRTGLNGKLSANKDMLRFLSGTTLSDNKTLAGCEIYQRIAEEVFFNEESNRLMHIFFEKENFDKKIIFAYGKDGCGRHFNLAHASGKSIFSISLGWYSQIAMKDRVSVVSEIARQCVCRDLLPVIEIKTEYFIDEKYRVSYRELVKQLIRFFNLIGVVSDKNLDEGFSDIQIFATEIKRADSLSQAKYWKYLANSIYGEKESILDAEALANLYTLTPAQIKSIVSELSALGEVQEEKEIERLISAALLRSTMMRLEGVAEHLESGFTMEDLVLPETQTELIRFVVDAVKQRYTVNEKMGFAKKLPYGRGHSLLMYGPPGTGKTMTAQVMANEIGLELFRVDSSKLTDKYIGETQKKIATLFDAAEDCNAILFFDEADALFGKRTEVSSSNDKHSNADVSYLLQRMEQYSGLTILATNHANDFDDAFKRRITYYLNIPIPDAETRAYLWSKVFPEGVDIAKDVDFEYLAEKYDFTGSSIKYVANMAAYYASINKTAINKAAILKGIQLEYAKNGKLFNAYEY